MFTLLDESTENVENEAFSENDHWEPMTSAERDEVRRLGQSVQHLEKTAATTENLSEIKAELGSIAITLGRVDERLKATEQLVKYAASAAFMWFVALTGFLWTASSRIAILEGKGSLTSTQRSLDSAKNATDAAISAERLSVQLQKKQWSDAESAPENFLKLGDSLKAASVRFSQVPSIWQASAELINLRFGASEKAHALLPNCWETFKGRQQNSIHPEGHFESELPAEDDMMMGNCELTLDDGPQFRNSGFGKAYSANINAYPNTRLVLFVHDARITYAGGRVVPIAQLNCRSCVVEADLNAEPAPEGRHIIRNLLTADTSAFRVTSAVGS